MIASVGNYPSALGQQDERFTSGALELGRWPPCPTSTHSTVGSQFADARDWAQFHTPKNLAMAMTGEVGELVAEFQWLTPEQAATVMAEDAEAAARIRAELADVTNYIVRLADSWAWI